MIDKEQDNLKFTITCLVSSLLIIFVICKHTQYTFYTYDSSTVKRSKFKTNVLTNNKPWITVYVDKRETF